MKEENKTPAVDNLPGVEINVADGDKVDKKLVKERTQTLNNNPRNKEIMH